MSRLSGAQRLPQTYNRGTLFEVVRAIEDQQNRHAEGRLTARHAALTAAPTTGDYARGDIVWNSEPSVLGSAGSRYVILGWVNVTAGSPGTFAEMRVLTGT
jgi:hypothetical protein